MTATTTLVAMLEQRARDHAGVVAYTFDDEPRTFEALWRSIETFAHVLRSSGVTPGARVVISLPNGHEFFTAFYGAQAAGAIAVPVFPGMTPSGIVQRAALCQSEHVVVPTSTPESAIEAWQASSTIRVLTTNTRSTAEETGELPLIAGSDVAFLQYTSGTTGDPKGVQLTHRNLLTNVEQMVEGMEVTSDDSFVSWLPCYHDMGLIVMTMMPFFVVAPLHLLTTQLGDVGSWLKSIEQHKGTFTASPDFGYRVCLRHASLLNADERPDLSSLRVAMNAAEPVRRATVENFHQTFGLNNVMVAAYGLAEATVGVSMAKPSSTSRIDHEGNVAVGRGFPGVQIQILDDDDQPVGSGTAGHIVVTSRAACSGYFQNTKASESLHVDGRADTIRTGDIGYLDADGHLYVVSRAKDVIIHAGRTVYPAEVEEVTNEVAGVRYTTAIGVDHGRVEGEQVTVFAEVSETMDESDHKTCVLSLTNAVRDRFGFRPARVYLVDPKVLPMTYNGKLQRAELKRRYLGGELEVRYPPNPRPRTLD